MKLVLAGITLLVATIAIGVGCGPTEKYCYQDMDTCEHVEKAKEADAMWKPEPDAEASTGTCFDSEGGVIACAGG